MSEEKDQLSLSVIGQIAIPVRNVDRSIVFYRDVLGMRFLFKAPPGLGFFDCNGVRLLLDEPAMKLETKIASILYFKVEDIQIAFRLLKMKGVQFDEKPELVAEMPDHDLWLAFFKDPDGNTLALMCEVPRGEPKA